MNEKSASKLLELQDRYDTLTARRAVLVREYDQMADGSRAGREHLKMVHQVSDTIREVEAEMDKVFEADKTTKLDMLGITESLLDDLVVKRNVDSRHVRIFEDDPYVVEGRVFWVQPSSGCTVLIHVTVVDNEGRKP